MAHVADFSELQLRDGTLVRFQLAPGDAPASGAEPPVAGLPEGMGHTVPVSRGGRAAASRALETLRSTLRPLGPFLQEVHDAVAASERPPHEVSVTFGVQVGHDLKLGIVGGNGQAHLTVSATWQPASTAD
ncbi:CU044_2847 family protein [Streptomyces sp. NPDC052682]|uniref:CU044_2847 family protein n=1 Tax=Streptomyces sp. NPDC052682 TaxID=3154954 RepID=UPI0034242515